MRSSLALVVVWLGGACSVLNGLDERPRAGDGDGGGGSDGGGPSDAAGCDATPVTPVQMPATVQLMFDVSGSMEQPLDDGGAPRYLALAEALTRVDGPLDQVDHMTRFGMTTFTSDPSMCPILSHLAAQLDARGPLAAALGAQQVIGFTVAES